MNKCESNQFLLKLDNLYRIVIPKKCRESIGLVGKQFVVAEIKDDSLIIKSHKSIRKFEFVYNFSKKWVDNYKDDTILITNFSECLYLIGKNSEQFENMNINSNLFDTLKDKTFLMKIITCIYYLMIWKWKIVKL